MGNTKIINIPDKWVYTKLGNILEKIEGGGTPSKSVSEYWEGCIPWASVKDIVTHNPYDTQDHISEIAILKSSTRLIPSGTLIAPTRMALGRAVFFKVDVAINQDLKALYPSVALDKNYLFYWFNANSEKIARLGNGSTVSGLPQNELKSIGFLLPPNQEQKSIVEVIETWDKYLEYLDKKINKKINLKNGLSQILLTGKKRIPGYKYPWGNYELKNICDIKKGSGLSKSKLKSNGKYNCILYGELYTKYTEIIKEVKSSTDSKEGIISIKGDILIPGSTTTSAIDLAIAISLNEDGVRLGGDINIIRAIKKYDSRFISLYLTHVKKHNLARLAQGITIVHLYGKDLKKLKLELPHAVEQTAIANILTSSSEEIETLKKKKGIISQQRKFLLNNLITGKIRLPEFRN